MQYKYNFEWLFDNYKSYYYRDYYVDKQGIIRRKKKYFKSKKIKTESPQEWYERRSARRKEEREKPEYNFEDYVIPRSELLE
jgi:hypothetical protein